MSNLEKSKIYKAIPDGSNDLPDIGDDVQKGLEDQFQLMLTKKKQYQKNLGIIRDTNYYFCVYFISEDQKKEFLTKLRALDLGEFFIDGFELSKRLGITITADAFANLPAPTYVSTISKAKEKSGKSKDDILKKFIKGKRKEG